MPRKKSKTILAYFLVKSSTPLYEVADFFQMFNFQ